MPEIIFQFIILLIHHLEHITCQDVFSCDFDLHLQRVLGGVGDLSCDVGNLANEHGEQELGFLHPNQSCQAAVLERRNRKPKSYTNIVHKR